MAQASSSISSRASTWRLDGGADETIAALAVALAPHVDMILEHNTELYSSLDMKIGICNPELRRALPILLSLITLDKRGGIFGQQELRGAVILAMTAAGKAELWDAKALAMATAGIMLAQSLPTSSK